MKRKAIVAALLASVLMLGAGAVPAWAYFTDNTMATGGLWISKPSTDIKEWYAEGVKHLTISNEADSSSPVFVRARVYASAELKTDVAGQGWTGPIGDWYYYGASDTQLTAVDPGNAANELTVAVTTPAAQKPVDWVPKVYEFGENYNVVIVYESVPAAYGADGTVDWSGADSTHTEEGGH